MFIDLIQIWKVRLAWKSAELNNIEFLKANNEVFKNIQIGGTFIPENLLHDGLSREEVLDCLKYLVEVLHIKVLRLGLRLNKIDIVSENLGIYDDILGYCFTKNVKLTLNLGPIKYCGWPEYHLSDTIKNNVSALPKIKSIVDSTCDLSCVSIVELENLLKLLVKKYTSKQLGQVVTLQAENEGFNPFGEYKWIFDRAHLSNLIEIFDVYLPKKQILFNSAGFFDIDSIVDFIDLRPDSERFIIGLDYYYTFDKFDHLRFYKLLDLYVTSWKLKNFSLSKLKRLQSIYGFKTEVTEAQMEAWGRAKAPGNSVESLKFVLLRSAQFLENNQGNINMYGLDRFAANAIKNNLNSEHRKMVDLIQKIQSK